MKNRANIKTMYQFGIISIIVILLIGIFSLLFFIIYSPKILSIKNVGFILLCIVIIGFILSIIFSIKELALYLKDYNSYKEENYLEVKGRVIGFESNRDPESGVQINSMPIIQTEDGNKIVLHVNTFLEVGVTYCFNYLKYTKIAEVKYNPN